MVPNVGYTSPMYLISDGVLSGAPVITIKEDTSAIRYFGIETLALLITTWIILSIVYFKFLVEHQFLGSKNPTKSFLSVLLSFYGVILNQGFPHAASMPARRWITSGWLITVVIISTAITAALSAQYSVSDKPIFIERIRDIPKYPSVSCYIPTRRGLQPFSTSPANDPNPGTSQKQFKMESFFNYKLFLKVVEGKAAIVENKLTLRMFVCILCYLKKQQYHISEDNTIPKAYVMLYRKGLEQSIAEGINKGFIRLGETGFHITETSKILTRSTWCLNKTPRTNRVGIGIEFIKAPIKLFVSGMVLAGMSCILEVFVIKYIRVKSLVAILCIFLITCLYYYVHT